MQILKAKNNIFKHISQKEKNPKNVFQSFIWFNEISQKKLYLFQKGKVL